MTKHDPRREVVAVRLTETDRARLDFWSSRLGRKTGGVASELLSRAVNQALLDDSRRALQGQAFAADEDEGDLIPTQAA